MLSTSQVRQVSVIHEPLGHTWAFVDEVTHGKPLESFRMGAGHQKEQPWDKRVGNLTWLDLQGGEAA